MIFAILLGYTIAILWIYLHRKQTYHNRKIYHFLQQLPHCMLQSFRFLSAVNIIFLVWLIAIFPKIDSNIAIKYFVYGGVTFIEYLIVLIQFYTLKILK